MCLYPSSPPPVWTCRVFQSVDMQGVSLSTACIVAVPGVSCPIAFSAGCAQSQQWRHFSFYSFLNTGMLDCLVSSQSGTGIKILPIPESVRLPYKGSQSGIEMLRYQTETLDAVMPMPPAGFGAGSVSGSAWICINLSCWIRIRIQEGKNDPQK